MKLRSFNIKFFKSDNKKKQAVTVFLFVLIAAVICEIFVFNYKFWSSASSTPISASPVEINGATKISDTQYRIYKKNAYIQYENLDDVVTFVRISPETGYDTAVKFYATDEGNEYPVSTPSRTVNTYVKPSQYIRLHFSGKVNSLKIELNNTSGTIIDLSKIELNTKVPMMFSIVRVLLMVSILMLLYILRPHSSIYNYKVDLRNKKQRLIAVLAAIIQIGVFVGFSYINSDALNWDKTEVHHRQYYNLIEAFKDGKLSTGEGSDSLKAMKNPYDYTARVENNVEFDWDNAYFNGKYYSYFGALPAILLYLPYNLITSGELPNHIAVVIFGTMVIIGVMLLLWEIIKKWYRNIPLVIYLMLCTVFSACSTLFYAVYKPDFYMVPPLAALAFSILGLALWIGAERKDGSLSTQRIMWGGLLIALTSMCRPQFLVTLFFGVVLFWNSVFKNRTLFSKSSVKQTLALIVPIVCVAAVAMWYNYARFGSPFDFGANYNLTTNDMTKRGLVVGRTGLGIFTYFLQPLRVDAQFPFVNDFTPATVYQGITITEKQMGGIFSMFPISLFAILGIFKKNMSRDKRAYAMICVSTAFSFIVAALDSMMAGILMRYFTDFAWLLMIAAVMTIFAVYNHYDECGSVRRIRQLKTILTVLCFFSMAVAFFSIFAHSKNAVWWSNSIAYHYVKYIFSFWL